MYIWHAKENGKCDVMCYINKKRKRCFFRWFLFDHFFSLLNCRLFIYDDEMYTGLHKANCYVKCRIKMMYGTRLYSTWFFDFIFYGGLWGNRKTVTSNLWLLFQSDLTFYCVYTYTLAKFIGRCIFQLCYILSRFVILPIFRRFLERDLADRICK